MQVCQFSVSSSLQFLRRRILNIFFLKIYPLCRPVNQSNKAIWTKVVCNMEDDSINISVKKKSNISSETAETVNFQFSHYKSMGTISCHSNQSSYPTGIKNTTFVEANVQSMYAKFQLHPPLVSEEKIFKHFYEN